MTTQLEHGLNCPGRYEAEWMQSCTCCFKWRVALQTEQTMSAAWRKRAEEAEAAAPLDGWVSREPKPGLLCGDVAISTDPRYAGWVFVRHSDGVNWTTGAKLTDETWQMLAAAAPSKG